MRSKIFFHYSISVFIMAFSSLSHAAITGKIVGILDGDTITILANANTMHKIRLYGIDSPESHQDFGSRAKKFTSEMVFGKTVRVISEAVDRYDRIVATVMIAEQSLNEELVKAGYAWVYKQYCKKPVCAIWENYEEDARKGSVGLWAKANPVPPWEFRRKTSRTVKTPSISVAKSSLGAYHGNTGSMILHAPGCKYYACSNCTAVFHTKDEAIKSGYKPCGVCMALKL